MFSVEGSNQEVTKNVSFFLSTLYVPENKITEFANSVALDDKAHNELPHLGLYCLPSSLGFLNMI